MLLNRPPAPRHRLPDDPLPNVARDGPSAVLPGRGLREALRGRLRALAELHPRRERLAEADAEGGLAGADAGQAERMEQTLAGSGGQRTSDG